jgi:hypothetical protein
VTRQVASCVQAWIQAQRPCVPQAPFGLAHATVGQVQVGEDGLHPGQHRRPALLDRQLEALLGVPGRAVQLPLLQQRPAGDRQRPCGLATMRPAACVRSTRPGARTRAGPAAPARALPGRRGTSLRSRGPSSACRRRRRPRPPPAATGGSAPPGRWRSPRTPGRGAPRRPTCGRLPAAPAGPPPATPGCLDRVRRHRVHQAAAEGEQRGGVQPFVGAPGGQPRRVAQVLEARRHGPGTTGGSPARPLPGSPGRALSRPSRRRRAP